MLLCADAKTPVGVHPSSPPNSPSPRAAAAAAAGGGAARGHASPVRPDGAARDDVASLVRAAADGDQSAWAVLVTRYQALLVATARQVGLDGADVADVTQTVWLQLFRHVKTLHTPEGLGSWLISTTRREAIRVSQKSRREVPTENQTFDVAAPVGHAVDTALLRAEQSQSVRDAVATLPPRSQLLLQLLVSAKESRYDKVAQDLHVPIGSLGPLRARTLASLRRTPQVAAIALDFGG